MGSSVTIADTEDSDVAALFSAPICGDEVREQLFPVYCQPDIECISRYWLASGSPTRTIYLSEYHEASASLFTFCQNC
ncbi:hypothetical protein DL770_008956 [Monosporascus sp. CRB-9-2]|nr:hypothetical protein DL770_008956 [Monosporascus sp. CRB-9-2]